MEGNGSFSRRTALKSMAAGVSSLVGASSIAGAARPSDSADDHVRNEIDDIRINYEVSGISVGLLENASSNRNTWTHVSGTNSYWMDPYPEALTTDHRLRLASVSKMLTESAILQLIDDGEIDQFDDVFGPDGILSGSEWRDPDLDPCRIDVNDLMDHEITADVSRPVYVYPDQENSDAQDVINAVIDADAISRDNCYSKQDYTNWSHAVLGAIVEEVYWGGFYSGDAFRSYVEWNILNDVANVDRTGMGTVADNDYPVVEDEGRHFDYRDGHDVYEDDAMRDPAWGWSAWAARPMEICRITRAIHEDELWSDSYDSTDAYMLKSSDSSEWVYHGGAQDGVLSYAYAGDEYSLTVLVNSRREWSSFSDDPDTAVKSEVRDHWDALV